MIYKTLRPLVLVLIKTRIRKALTDALQTGREYVDEEPVEVKGCLGAAWMRAGEQQEHGRGVKNGTLLITLACAPSIRLY